MSSNETGDRQGRTIVGDDGRILLFSCQRFLSDICDGDACFICGASPNERRFNDEHIVPRWILRRFKLFDKEITLPNGERRKYGGYRVPCCESCNDLLGRKIEEPVSKLLDDGDYSTVIRRLGDRQRQLLFVWLALLFLKIHLKDQRVPIHRDRRQGSEPIGEMYHWPELHHVHAIARAPYTGASLLPEAIGSLQIFEIEDGLLEGRYDYQDFTFEQTMIIRLGRIGIVASLNDSTAAESVWFDRLELVNGPISELQLREVGAMFSLANRNLVQRPIFSTIIPDKRWVLIAGHRPPLQLKEFDPKEFGETLLFAVRDFVTARAIEVDGSRDPKYVSNAISSGHVRFLTDKDGRFVRNQRPAKTPDISVP